MSITAAKRKHAAALVGEERPHLHGAGMLLERVLLSHTICTPMEGNGQASAARRTSVRIPRLLDSKKEQGYD
jgi:hypothetical protein